MKGTLDTRLEALIKKPDIVTEDADVEETLKQEDIISNADDTDYKFNTEQSFPDDALQSDESVFVEQDDKILVAENRYQAGFVNAVKLFKEAVTSKKTTSKEDLVNVDKVTKEQKELIKQDKKLKSTEQQNVFKTLKKQSAFESKTVEKNAKKAKIDLKEIIATGANGKITQSDLDNYILKTTKTEPPKDIVYITKDEINVESFFDEHKDYKVGSGIDYNFRKFDTSESINEAIDKTSILFKDKIDKQKRGKLSFDATKELAKTLNITEDVLNSGIGNTFNAEQLLAARHVLVRSARHLEFLKDKVLTEYASKNDFNKVDSKTLLEFKSHLHKHSAIQLKLKGLQTEAARALAQFRIPVDGWELLDEKTMSRYIVESGGAKEMVQVAQYLDKLEDGHQKSHFVEGFGTWFKKAYGELYQASLMSSPASLERNFFGQMSMNLIRSFDSLSSATVGKIIDKPITYLFGSRSSDKAYLTESMLDIYNFFSTLPHSMAQGWKAFKNNKQEFVGYSEYTKKQGTNIDSDRVQGSAWTKDAFADPNSFSARTINYMGNLFLYAFRFTMFGDEIGKASVYQMEKRKRAFAQAMQALENGTSYDDASKGMMAQIESPDANLLKQVEEQVKEGTLVADLGKYGQFFQRLRNDATFQNIPFGKVFVPFLKTVINIQKEIMKRTAITAPFLKEVRDDIAAGGRRRQIALGKASAGSMVLGYFYTLAAEGMITGAGPADPKLRKQLMEDGSGWKPFSIKVGDKYISYTGLEPLGGLMGIAASVAEMNILYNVEESEKANLAFYALMMPFKYIGELPFMDSFSNFVDVMEKVKTNPNSEQSTESLTRFVGSISQNMIGGVTPIPMPLNGLLRQINNYHEGKTDVQFDPSLPPLLKEFDFLYRKAISKIPGNMFGQENQDKIPIQRNIWGEQVKYSSSGWNWIFPYWTSEENFDDVTRDLNHLARDSKRASISMPLKKIDGIKLNDREYNDLLFFMNNIKIKNKTMKQTIGKVINKHRKEFNKGFYADGFSAISSTVNDFKKRAIKGSFKTKYPDTYDQIETNRKLINQGEFASRLKRIPIGYKDYFNKDNFTKELNIQDLN